MPRDRHERRRCHTPRKVCSPFKQGGRTYRSETLGTGWTCASAKAWIVKLIGDRVHIVSKSVPLTNGPRGYHCAADPTSEGGHATAGHCIKGTIAFPQKRLRVVRLGTPMRTTYVRAAGPVVLNLV